MHRVALVLCGAAYRFGVRRSPCGRVMSPSILLGVLLGSLCGLLCHACLGRGWRWLPLYWIVGLLGFFSGCVLAILGNLSVLRLGSLPVFEGIVGAILALAATWWLTGRRRMRPAPGVG